ncbi:MAG: MerR family transcriptional regulator [Flavobacteriaceae bacterium]|nr:MerR family transcriptional regulator [Bacteroidia bacterium]NNF85006.1 MerR family transcriptional regulator [Winogradskyella sp.]NNK28074.1 MerR family transcriptional regulator [Flavobacteriaceae bacterium]RZV59558.1 MAG: MerR family transcriptional regulator [Flavobacteriaceae bacterium]
MNNVKSNFSIKDLENLSGIKAHTIRIWEKRYNLLQPNRTETNIRYYNLANLQKLLNVTFLYNHGYKISKIAKLGEGRIPQVVNEIVAESSAKGAAINSFKMAMLNFDQTLFFNTYNGLLKEKSFREIFYDVFIPLLTEMGLLWQTDTITPSHEHFISAMIKQKILVNTEKLQMTRPKNKSKTFVLYLPDNEVHELGLMYINYEILLHGYHAIFLGQSIPVESLKDLLPLYDDLIFVSYFTVRPTKDDIHDYLEDFNKQILSNNGEELWLLGKMLKELDESALPKKIKAFHSIVEFVEKL